MRGPFTWQHMVAQFGDNIFVAPLGARPTASEPFFRVIHDGPAPGLSHHIVVPGHARRPQIEDVRTAWRRLRSPVALVLDTNDTHITFSHDPRGWGLLSRSTGVNEGGQEDFWVNTV